MLAIVNAPALRLPPHSLVAVGNEIVGERIEGGVAFTPRGCDVLFGHAHDCSFGEDKALQTCTAPASFYPYTLEITVNWPLGDLAADPKALVVEAMEIGTSAALERLIEKGVAGTKPLARAAFAGAISSTGLRGRVAASTAATGGATYATIKNPLLKDAQDIGGTGLNASAALGMVEAKLLDADDHIGGAGTVYMSPAVFTRVTDAVTEVDGQYVTKATGSRVVIGNFAVDTIYGHPGDVDVYVGPIVVAEATDRATNGHIVQAERTVIAAWNPCAVVKQAVA